MDAFLQDTDTSGLELSEGSRIAVIGGGPAGSFLSYFLPEMASRVGLRVQVDIYEPRDFSRQGPPGCNMCAGIISESLVQILAAEGINLPRDSNQQVYLGTLVGTRWSRERLRSGDTLYFLGSHGKIRHTAIYLGDGQYLESVRPTVRTTSFNPQDENYDARRAAAFAFAKRLLEYY